MKKIKWDWSMWNSWSKDNQVHISSDWWKHPVFDFGLNYPCPYIWFLYWLITWEDDEITITFLAD